MRTKIKMNPRYKILYDFVCSIPYMFPFAGEVVYSGRNIIKSFTCREFDLNVKAFKVPNVLNRFVYRYIRKSEARHSYEQALDVSGNGIGAPPEPIAYIEIYSRHLLQASYYISMQVNEEGTTGDKSGRGTRNVNWQLESDFIAFTANLHKKDI